MKKQIKPKKQTSEKLFGYPIVPIVRDVLSYKKSGTALDLGCGVGRHALYLTEKGFTITAIDKAKDKVSDLRRNAKKLGLKITAKQSDLVKLKLRTRYDVILAIMSLHFLEKRQITKLIDMMQAYTKPNGLNVVAVLTDKQPKGFRPYLFGKNELRNYYKKWKILEYEEKYSKYYIKESTGKKERQHRVTLIAQNL